MDTNRPTLPALFAQLGLDNDDAAIEAFIHAHHPVSMTTHLADASFWSVSQAALIREKLSEDAQWAPVVDTLSALLREHLESDGGAAGDPELQGEGNYVAARRYDDAVRQFVASGKVCDAARRAEPRNAQEAVALKDAEAAGLAKARS